MTDLAGSAMLFDRGDETAALAPRAAQPTDLRAAGARPRILLLQGPVGPFMRRLADALDASGAEILKVHFCLGDRLAYGMLRRRGVVDYKDGREAWPAALRRLLAERKITDVVLFGDQRPLHKAAIKACQKAGVLVHVLEEGYVRPDHVTLDLGGACAASALPKLASAFDEETASPERAAPRVGNPFFWAAAEAMLYFTANALGRRFYPGYRHHKEPALLKEAALWLRSAWRKLKARRDRRRVQSLVAGGRPRFVVPLQIPDDSQIVAHSRFPGMASVVADVLASFARAAPDEAMLIFKHHPMDRGHRCYARIIRRLAEAAGCAERVLYLREAHLPTLLKGAAGCVTVNSTVGFSALRHGTPVKTLGAAFYDLPGLTHQGPLDAFWTAPQRPDGALQRRVRARVLRETQVGGSFYRNAGATAARVAERLLRRRLEEAEKTRGAADAAARRLAEARQAKRIPPAETHGRLMPSPEIARSLWTSALSRQTLASAKAEPAPPVEQTKNG